MIDTELATATEGRWTACPSGPTMRGYSQPFAIAQEGKPNLIAGVFGDVAGGESVAAANARLLASAPDLFAALEAAYERFGDYRSDWRGRISIEGQSLLSKMRDALVMATGRDPQSVQDDYGTRLAQKSSAGQ